MRGSRLDAYSSPDPTQPSAGSDYELLRHIDVPQLNKHCWNDLVACECEQFASLFISDHRHKCVHKLATVADTAVSKLTDVPYKPHGLSVTPDHTLLLTCRDDHMLMEVDSKSGALIQQIELPDEIDCPYHAVRLTSGQFVVCYGTTGSGDHGVSMVDCRTGTMTQNFTELHYPSHVLVDAGTVYVSDHYNRRVVMLNSSLELVREFGVGSGDWPWRLCLDDHTRRLIVGLEKGDVIILQLLRRSDVEVADLSS